MKSLGGGLTAASSTAAFGMVMLGKEYMAPCTGLQLMPGTVFRISSVSLAFSAKALSVAVRSWMKEGGWVGGGGGRKKKRERKNKRKKERLIIINIHPQ